MAGKGDKTAYRKLQERKSGNLKRDAAVSHAAGTAGVGIASAAGGIATANPGAVLAGVGLAGMGMTAIVSAGKDRMEAARHDVKGKAMDQYIKRAQGSDGLKPFRNGGNGPQRMTPEQAAQYAAQSHAQHSGGPQQQEQGAETYERTYSTGRKAGITETVRKVGRAIGNGARAVDRGIDRMLGK